MVSIGSRESSIHYPTATAFYGDQGIHICDACCKGYRCNAADCFNLIRKSESAIVSFSLFTYISFYHVFCYCIVFTIVYLEYKKDS